MKYKPETYARALLEVIRELPRDKHDDIARRFMKTISKNGDMSRVEKILTAVKRATVAKNGGRVVRITLARDSDPAEKNFRELFPKKDLLEKEINPDMVAGIRLLINGEKELDISLKRKILKIFK